jgi:glycosyltransferase involved in cell wall biosynthesis
MFIINSLGDNSGSDTTGFLQTISKRRKILFLIPSLTGGGAERVLVNLLNNFDYHKYEITVCIGVNKGIYVQEIPDEVKTIVLFRNHLMEKLAVLFHRHLNSRVLPRIIINHKIRNSYDVGISFIDGYYTDFMLTISKKIKSKIAWVHASYGSYKNYSRFYKGSYKTRLIEERYKKLDKIIFVSNDSLSEFKKIFGLFDNSEVAYNFLDIENIRIKSLEKTEGFIDKAVVNIVAVGSLLPVKAFAKLIIAAQKLRDDHFKFKIRIIGDGYLKNQLLGLINSSGVTDYVELSGFLINPYSLMKASDIFVMTSESEALPTALCEAMILGLPCVVTDCSGCREIVNNGEFGLMTGQSADEIYTGIKTLLSDPDLRDKYKLKARQRSLIFNDEKTLEKIYSIL